MPTSPALTRFLRREPIPSELRTAEWESIRTRLGTWATERAYFLAGVAHAEVLAGFRAITAARIRGEISPAQARERAAELLDRVGYDPAAGTTVPGLPGQDPGQSGTIKDLRAPHRQTTAIETSVEMAHGWAALERQNLVARAYPGLRLVRARRATIPRDWPQRWADAGGESGATRAPSSEDGDMVALLHHPIWARLSRWGLPHAPFDYLSGMVTEPVSMAEAEALGLFDTDPPPPLEYYSPRPTASLNADLAARPDLGPDPAQAPAQAPSEEPAEKLPDPLGPELEAEGLRAQLADHLAGFAEFDPQGILRFTDPNGTRPYTPDQLADVITRPLPARFQHHQAAAVRTWADQPSAVRAAGPGSDLFEDLLRFIRRATPVPPGTVLFRGENFPHFADFIARLDLLRRDGILGRLVAAATADPATADAFTRYGGGAIRVLYRILDAAGIARDISPSVQRLSPDHDIEAEHLFDGRARFAVDGPIEEVPGATGSLYIVPLRTTSTTGTSGTLPPPP
jgi:hypothetical protein